tara:strand:- start:1429 stop:1881 length:453 start_codon:yes stop_codon:yes gene_type:complete
MKNFIDKGKGQCRARGCTNKAVTYTGQYDIKGKTIHCVKHHMYKISGRIDSANFNRDQYREHLSVPTAFLGITFKDEYFKVRKINDHFVKQGIIKESLTKRELIRRTMQCFEADHINGDHYDNRKENIQTVTKQEHKFKTDVCGDSNGWR